MNNTYDNKELKEYLSGLLGAEYAAYMNASPENQALRINTLKIAPDKFNQYLSQRGVVTEKIPFTPYGLQVIRDDLPLSHSLAFFTGKFQYQGISSQLPVILLDPQPGERVLDMAAAPGSKSTQIAALMGDAGELVLNDYSHQRLQALNTNVQRSGVRNSITFNFRGERLGRLFHNYFDRVLVDAPCSALGTISGSPEVQGWWSLDKLGKLTGIQRYLLISALKAVKPGGYVVYSTCSVAPEENERLVDEIIRKYPVEVADPPAELAARFDCGYTQYGDINLDPGLARSIRVWPQRHSMEGFFAVKLQKTGEIPDLELKNKPPVRALLVHDHELIRPILNELSEIWGIPDTYWPGARYYLTKERIWMVTASVETIPATPFVSAGLLLAERRLTGWKVVNSSVQLLGETVTKRLVELPDEQLLCLFAEGKIPCSGQDNGYYVLIRRDERLASLYVENDSMRIRLPHRFKLVF